MDGGAEGKRRARTDVGELGEVEGADPMAHVVPHGSDTTVVGGVVHGGQSGPVAGGGGVVVQGHESH